MYHQAVRLKEKKGYSISRKKNKLDLDTYKVIKIELKK